MRRDGGHGDPDPSVTGRGREAKDGAQRYRTVGRVVEALEVFVAAGRPIRLTTVAKELGAPVSSTQALLRELERSGMLTISDDKEYSAGPRLVALGVRLMLGMDIVAHARGPMTKLAQETHEYVYLAIPEGDTILYADRVATAAPNLRVDIPLGVPRPLYATAAGQVYLATRSPEEVREIVARQPFSQETARTIMEPAKLERRLAEIRRRGYAITHEEAIVGVVGTAAAIRDASGRFAGAITISALRGRRTLSEQEIIERLLATCAEIGQALGWDPSREER
jgi:DNA-binding IclR family transcriptional regulator